MADLVRFLKTLVFQWLRRSCGAAWFESHLPEKRTRVGEPEVRSEGQSCGNLSPLTVSAHANEALSERTCKGLYAMVSKRSRGEADLRAAARQRVD